MSLHTTQTIAAVATGLPGAIGILRLSGPNAVSIAAQLFRAADGLPLETHPPRSMVYGSLLDSQGKVIDRMVCTYSRGPASYTGEDTAELQCHGSPLVLQLGLEALFHLGARQALPGEFTKRAFLNGRLDLAQAEAVVDLIDAQSREGVYQSAGQLAGALSRRVDGIYSGLVDLMAHFHAVLDYPDEDIDPFKEEQMVQSMRWAQEELTALLSTHRRGESLVGGLPCAITGKPNAGKSSLLNALLGYDRAIVTDIPGTTRDTVEERVRLGGVLLRLIDTAGLRDSADPIERMGVERSRTAMEQAALILFLCDQSVPFTQEDARLLEQATTCAPTILVWNKTDLPSAPTPFLHLPEDMPVVEVSAKTGQGLDALEQAVASLVPHSDTDSGALLTNARQADAARRALESVSLARQSLQAGYTPDAVLVDIENALSALGELTGRSVREDITARIFERFCVGK
ncbi:MAG: tRNA uridine-5-carboxymethylaminomethyl(34) synthesis GTPase MnmE [Oscillospiraceae bacterium]|nr:tRNA uridine-5-carboxymethylaminomethyl(34) synthesis GTPase MnmE [Oscillospiraceae bacterium]